MNITVKDIENLISILLTEVKQTHGNVIVLKDDDLYWEIDEDEMFNPISDPHTFRLQSCEADIKELFRLKEKGSIPISYDLKRLAVLFLVLRRSGIGLW